MSEELDFTIEFNSEGLHKNLESDLFTEAERRMRKLTKGHSDIVGTAVNVRQPARQNTPIYEATVVAYGRPEHVSGTEKAENPHQALKGALDAVERQVRKRREKLSKHWEQPGNKPAEQEIAEILAAEGLAEDETPDDNIPSTL